MPGFMVNSDGDVEMTVPQPIFELIGAPELRSWEHAALIEWHREWERYVEKIRHRCGITNEAFESVVATVKGSVRPKTLRNMATYVLNKPLSSVTDADIMEAVQARCRTLKNESVPDVTSLFRQQLKMGHLSTTAMQGSSATTRTSMPPVLKAQITRLIDLERRDCKSNDVALFDLILEHAKVQQRFHWMSQDHAGNVDPKLEKPERKGPRPGHAKPGPPRSAPPAASPSTPARASRLTRPPPQDGCLVCKGPHWLADCPTATNVQRDEARRKCRESKEQHASAMRSKSTRYVDAAGTVRINGLVEMADSPDTGTDQSVVPQETVDSLCVMQPSLQVMSL
ncbi:hypothetical protein PC129_g17226 [Phytophthora cactorum]|uniref:Uncharacterized protein n=2 Tax=Phytophthora cactorum TaxID=29920 RepID=A0A329RJU8_9STRA|nr:hypothetical protein PC112_g19103 [Phytophthora cactorum]KAG2991600.1 hypothetical protein PC119_g18850 [Phytophthora cactorum]KAG3211803.1 hypothetical protein PC129_g17226 [Phytophthora cactorum]RAW24917.1 hypothetical protein PC110_g18663 [Phytophthora cactorum]